MSVTPRIPKAMRTVSDPWISSDSPSSLIEEPPITLKEYQQQFDYLRKENFTLKMLIWQMTSKIHNVLYQNEDSEGLEASRVMAESPALGNQLREVLQLNEKLQEELNKKNQDEDVVGSMQRLMQENEDELNRLRQENEELRKHIQESEDLHGMCDQLIKKNEELIEERDHLKQENQDLQQEIENLKSEGAEHEEEEESYLKRERDDAVARAQELQAEVDRLKELLNDRNDEIVEQLQREKQQLQDQVDVLAQERQDLANEIDSLRRMPRVMDDMIQIGTSPVRARFRGDTAQSSFQVSPARKSGRNSPRKVSTLTSPVPQRTTVPSYEELRVMLEREKTMSRNLRGYATSFARRLDQFGQHVNSRLTELFQQMIGIVRKLLEYFNTENETTRNDFTWFKDESQTMVSDMRKGAKICIDGSLDFIKLIEKRKGSTMSKEDRNILVRLQKEWKKKIRGWLGDYIDRANELSMLMISNSPMKKEDSPWILEQLQILIHAIWSALDEDSEEPKCRTGDSIGTRLPSLIKIVIMVLNKRVNEMRQRIEQLTQQYEEIMISISGKGLHPYVIKLIKMVSDNVQTASASLHQDHRELMTALASEKAVDEYPNLSSEPSASEQSDESL